MPGPLEKRLNECGEKLDVLAHGIVLNEEIKRQLKGLKEYYRKLYLDAADDEEEDCIKIYELIIQGIECVKSGQLKPEDALKEIEEINSLRKSGIVLENILTALELLFWATAAVTFFSACVLIASPMIAANPFLALAALTLACTWAIYSVVNFFDCIDKFKSLSPIEEECKREKDIISFFKPAVSSQVSGIDETDQQQKGLYPKLDGLVTVSY